MPDRALNISFRPHTFDDLIGQGRIVKLIRTRMASGRLPAAWMFTGASGVGKTTVARIIAVSLQCKHQEQFGLPCENCYKHEAQFDIIEVNASEASGIDETESVISGAYYSPKPPSSYRVYIFDEAQKLSNASQNALLKYFEDCPKSTVWMICTTEPGKVLRTLRRRCYAHPIPELTMKGVEKLVRRAIEFAGEKLPADPLVEALLEAGVCAPGFVVAAVDKYLDGEEPEKAILVGMDATLDTLRICRAVVKGDWDTVRQVMFAASPDDARAVRSSLGGYLKTVLLDTESGHRAKVVSDGIRELAALTSVEDGLQLSGTVATLYRLCQHFNGGR